MQTARGWQGLAEDIQEMFSGLSDCPEVDGWREERRNSFHDPHAAADKYIAASEEERKQIRQDVELEHLLLVRRRGAEERSSRATSKLRLQAQKAAASIAYDLRHPEKRSEQKRAWREANRERWNARRRELKALRASAA